jgi:predicted PurR-regulated permease PerM
MTDHNQKTVRYHVDITPRSFLVLAIGGITLLALWIIRDFVLLVLISVIIASFVNAGVKLLRRLHIPRTVGVLFMYLFFLGIIALIIFVFFPLLFKELSGVIDYLPKSSPWAKLLNRVSDNGLTESTLRSVLGTSNIFQGLQNFWKVYLTDSVLTGITTVFHAVSNIVLVFIMSFFLSIKEGGVNSFLRAMTPVQYEAYVVGLWDRVEEKIGYWFGGQFLLAFLAGAMAFIGLSFIGVPYVLLLSIIVMILELIPFGLILGTLTIVPFVMVSQGLSVGITTLIFFLIINFLETNVFQPLIVHKTVGIPMLLVIISLIAWIELIGWTGAIIAIPFAVVILEIIYDREKTIIEAGKEAIAELKPSESE